MNLLFSFLGLLRRMMANYESREVKKVFCIRNKDSMQKTGSYHTKTSILISCNTTGTPDNSPKYTKYRAAHQHSHKCTCYADDLITGPTDVSGLPSFIKSLPHQTLESRIILGTRV